MTTYQRITSIFVFTFCTQVILGASVGKGTKPNIIIFFADDISAREIPIYGSTVWSDNLQGGDSKDIGLRAKTPVMDDLATKGCWITNAWAATICNPSRAMIMSGRHAHITKWWNNGDRGVYKDQWGNLVTWPIYESSPLLMSHVANQAGYGTFWCGKTQVPGSYEKHGFDEGCFSPGRWTDLDNPNTDFRLLFLKNEDGKKILINEDTGEEVNTYKQHSWYFHPEIKLMNHPANPGEIVWWPNTPEAKKNFGLETYGPDVELEMAFDFIERQKEQDKPFLIYHTSHLGHDAFDWLDLDSKSKWPGTPVIKWDGEKYIRTSPKITGDKGDYNTHRTVTEPGIHHQINYIDYQLWRYINKLEEMGIEDNTIIIFTADNGTSGYGKNTAHQQRGTHVPMIIYAPGMTKKGKQDTMVSLADILPTIAELSGFELPKDYEMNGESLVPFLFEDKRKHRDWVYSYRGPEQFIRGDYVLKDGADRWWDVSDTPNDLTSFKEIKDWAQVSENHKNEKEKLLKILPKYDLYYKEHDSPGMENRFPKNTYYQRKQKPVE